MATPVKLPRIKRRGNSVVNAALINWQGWIEYVNNLTGRWPVNVNKTATGPVITVDLAGFLPRIMVVTTTLPAATGTTSLTIGTTGRARNAKFDAATNVLSDDTGATIEVVRNFHNKTFVAGAFIKAAPQYGELWAFDINDCAKFI